MSFRMSKPRNQSPHVGIHGCAAALNWNSMSSDGLRRSPLRGDLHIGNSHQTELNNVSRKKEANEIDGSYVRERASVGEERRILNSTTSQPDPNKDPKFSDEGDSFLW